MSARPRIALLGFSLESNGFAPVATRADFEQSYLLAGEALEADLVAQNPRAVGTLTGFHARMDKTGPWEPVPIVVAATTPAGWTNSCGRWSGRTPGSSPDGSPRRRPTAGGCSRRPPRPGPRSSRSQSARRQKGAG